MQDQKATINGILHYEQIGTTTAGNIAIVAMSAQRNYERPTQVQVFARLANFGPDPVSGVQVLLRSRPGMKRLQKNPPI